MGILSRDCVEQDTVSAAGKPNLRLVNKLLVYLAAIQKTLALPTGLRS